MSIIIFDNRLYLGPVLRLLWSLVYDHWFYFYKLKDNKSTHINNKHIQWFSTNWIECVYISSPIEPEAAMSQWHKCFDPRHRRANVSTNCIDHYSRYPIMYPRHDWLRDIKHISYCVILINRGPYQISNHWVVVIFNVINENISRTVYMST